MPTGKIYKAAGIIIRDRRLLLERSTAKEYFVAPGGKLEADESYEQALIRELREEFQINVKQKDLEFFSDYSAEAANHPGQMVYMRVFIVRHWHGELRPDHEVEEMIWLDSRSTDGLKIGSIFGGKVLPALKERNLVD